MAVTPLLFPASAANPFDAAAETGQMVEEIRIGLRHMTRIADDDRFRRPESDDGQRHDDAVVEMRIDDGAAGYPFRASMHDDLAAAFFNVRTGLAKLRHKVGNPVA